MDIEKTVGELQNLSDLSTFHPAFLMRQPESKEKWHGYDLKDD